MKTNVHTKMWTPMLIVALFVIEPKAGKSPMFLNNIMEFYSAVKSNELLIDSTTGMTLKDIMLKKENQSQQVTNHMTFPKK